MLKKLKYLIPFLLMVALFAAIVWLINAPDFEPAVTSLALLTSLIAIFTDKWIAEKEKRKELLVVLFNELFINLLFKSDLEKVADNKNVQKIQIYPRFHTVSLATVIASGAFTGEKDAKIYQQMNLWHQFSCDYNNRLYHTELKVLGNKESAATYNKLLATGAISVQAFETLDSLMDILIEDYYIETGINRKAFEDKLKKTLKQRG